jgi:hypothetical protein
MSATPRALRGGSAQVAAQAERAVIVEADEALIERRVPQCREEEPVVHVEPLFVAAVRPRHDVGGTRQSGLGDAGQRTAASPVIHQRVTEHVLADALDNQPLSASVVRGRPAVAARKRRRGASGMLTASL